MGKQQKRFNWKARAQPEGEVDLSAGRQLEARLGGGAGLKGRGGAAWEGSNALVLPSSGNKFKPSSCGPAVGKILSRKQRKRLEKIVDQKKKKEGRAELLAALQTVQADSLAGMESLASVQTKGVKRQLEEREELPVVMQQETVAPTPPVAETKLEKKKRRRANLAKEKKVKEAKRPDIVGYSESSSEDSSEDSDQEEQQEGGTEQRVDSRVEESVVERISDEKADDDADDQVVPNTTEVTRPDEEEPDEAVPATSHRPAGLQLVTVSRGAGMAAARARLPILGQEQEIMELVGSQGVLVLSGETGCGKTTQLPQFLYEAGYAGPGLIGVTQPRRVAATAMAARVGSELGLGQEVVSYQVRYEGTVTDQTRVKFMTDGVLLREVERDFLLRSYSVIIIDEAHERSVFTDILLGLLSRIVPLRLKKTPDCPLKVIIMSATLRVTDFTSNPRLFLPAPPVVSVDSRQFPVTVHFNKRTVEDYLGESLRKVCKIHRELPEGGILVFVTGQQEVNTLVRKLRERFPSARQDQEGTSQKEEEEEEYIRTRLDREKQFRKKKKVATTGPTVSELLPDIELSDYAVQPLDDTEGDGAEDGEEEDLDLDDPEEGGAGPGGGAPLHVLPLYSLLDREKQARVWAGAPPGARLCVVATNIAETSLTIPGVKFVVDTGRVKVKHWDRVTGVSTFLVDWVSRAQANQRAGRAGRQGPGHCYRLYSSAVFSDLAEFTRPEILSRPVDDLLLQMKAMGIEKVQNFPFPSPPSAEQLRAGETRLQQLGCLARPPPGLPASQAERARWSCAVTPLGRAVACFPLAPRYGKMLALARQHDLLPLALSLVAALTVPELLVDTAGSGKLRQLRRSWAGQGASLQLGDAAVLLGAVAAASKASWCPQYCASVGIRHKAVQEFRRLRRQLASEVGRVSGEAELGVGELAVPTPGQARLLAQLLLAGSPDRVARLEEGGASRYTTGELAEQVSLHPGSVLARHPPAWCVYTDIQEREGVVRLGGVTAVEPAWLPSLCPALTTLGPALTTPAPTFSPPRVLATFQPTFGAQAWKLPPTQLEMPRCLDKFKWFGRFLLEGVAAPALQKFSSSLLSSPLVMVKSWSSLQKRTEALLAALAGRECDSGARLAELWAGEPQYLLQPYLAWLPDSLHQDVRSIWPPAVAQ